MRQLFSEYIKKTGFCAFFTEAHRITSCLLSKIKEHQIDVKTF